MAVDERTEAFIGSRFIKTVNMPLPEANDRQSCSSIFTVENVDFYYDEKHALKSINLEIPVKKATA
jgi:hypothetical protein